MGTERSEALLLWVANCWIPEDTSCIQTAIVNLATCQAGTHELVPSGDTVLVTCCSPVRICLEWGPQHNKTC